MSPWPSPWSSQTDTGGHESGRQTSLFTQRTTIPMLWQLKNSKSALFKDNFLMFFLLINSFESLLSVLWLNSICSILIFLFFFPNGLKRLMILNHIPTKASAARRCLELTFYAVNFPSNNKKSLIFKLLVKGKCLTQHIIHQVILLYLL